MTDPWILSDEDLEYGITEAVNVAYANDDVLREADPYDVAIVGAREAIALIRPRVEAAASAREARLVEALEGLVNAVEETAMSSIGIFQFAALHGVVYNGMTTEAAMDRARAALGDTTPRTPTPGEEAET